MNSSLNTPPGASHLGTAGRVCLRGACCPWALSDAWVCIAVYWTAAAVAALANKMARTIWALLAHEREFQKGYVSQPV